MHATLTEIAVRAATPEQGKAITLWDGSLKHFGVRIASGVLPGKEQRKPFITANESELHRAVRPRAARRHEARPGMPLWGRFGFADACVDTRPRFPAG